MFLPALCLWLLIINAATYAAFAHDKACACLNRWRVPEARLLLMALIGGWPAAKLAQHKLRHKTRKQPFATQLNAVLVMQVLVLGGAVSLGAANGLSPGLLSDQVA